MNVRETAHKFGWLKRRYALTCPDVEVPGEKRHVCPIVASSWVNFLLFSNLLPRHMNFFFWVQHILSILLAQKNSLDLPFIYDLTFLAKVQ
jgi:hypothetical protein